MSSYFRNNDGYRAAPDQSRPPDNINRGGNMSRPSSRPSSGQSRPTSSSAKIPPYFLCPISHQLMEDPTITKCGHMFDKETLINYINERTMRMLPKECPVCNTKVDLNGLAPCFPLKSAIADFKMSLQSKKQGGEIDNRNLGSNDGTLNRKMLGMNITKERDVRDGVVKNSPQRGSSKHINDVQNGAGYRGSTDNLAKSSKKKTNNKKKDPMNGPVWLQLTPMITTGEPIEISQNECSFGRAPNCDHVFNFSELSGTHCVIYRVKREGTDIYDVFLEDKSSNGTFLNGSRVGKNIIAQLVSGDEISFGERLTTKIIPKVPVFVDWSFLGTDLNPDEYEDIKCLKSVEYFTDLLNMDDNQLKSIGVISEFVRAKINSTLRSWLEKYRFPAFYVDLVGEMGVKDNNENPNNADRVCEVNFDPKTYSESASSGAACFYLRRTKDISLAASVIVRSIPTGLPQIGIYFQPFEKMVVFKEGSDEAVVEFFWKTDAHAAGTLNIEFEGIFVNGKGNMGAASKAKLTIVSGKQRAASNDDRRQASPPISIAPPPARDSNATGGNRRSKPDSFNPSSSIGFDNQKKNQDMESTMPRRANQSQKSLPFSDSSGNRRSSGDKSKQQPAYEDYGGSNQVIGDRNNQRFAYDDYGGASQSHKSLPFNDSSANRFVSGDTNKNQPSYEDYNGPNQPVVDRYNQKSAYDNHGGANKSRKSLPSDDISSNHRLPSDRNQPRPGYDDFGSNEGGHKENQKNDEDNELVGRMMDSFPVVDAETILQIIKEERQMIFPLDDPKLLQDLVAIQLTNLTRGNANDLALANVKMISGPEKESNVDKEQSNPLLNAAVSNEPPPIPNSNKPIQTILRSELENFLISASISLIRKFSAIQGIDINMAHFTNPIISTSMNIAEIFLGNANTMTPIFTGETSQDDVFDFEKIVEAFKEFVYSNGNEIRSKVHAPDRSQEQKGYRFDVAFQKSAHHVKMENNHAIIEDMNTLAKLPDGLPMNSFFGVFDGHGAENIAKSPLFLNNIIDAIKNTYLTTDINVNKKASRENLKGGSTAVTAIIREKSIYIAWAGDSRCVIFRRIDEKLKAFEIAVPHNPQGSEKTRCINAGGSVDYVAGKWRVNGKLAVTRSFGDSNLKPVVIAEPEIVRYDLVGDEVFLMLSCDGVFDVMDYPAVADYLGRLIDSDKRMGELSNALVNEAVKRGSKDDITVMLVDLSREWGPRIQRQD